MVKAVFLDFYGTVVHEDGAIIKIVNERIFKSGNAEKPSDIGTYWWNEFQNMFIHSQGETFRTQRYLEMESLANTIKHFHSTENAIELSELMFDHWIKPLIYEESKTFFEMCPVLIYIVSNIDTDDIIKALAFHNLKPADIITSEVARSYKPQKDIFEFALQKSGLLPQDVVHIGDSIKSDVEGASALGINTILLNRFNRYIPETAQVAISNLLETFETKYFMKK